MLGPPFGDREVYMVDLVHSHVDQNNVSQRSLTPILGTCGYSEAMTSNGSSCVGWGGVSLDNCMAYCAGNTVANNCDYGSNVCTHIGFWPISGWCHLYRSCEDTVRAHPTSNRTPHTVWTRKCACSCAPTLAPHIWIPYIGTDICLTPLSAAQE